MARSLDEQVNQYKVNFRCWESMQHHMYEWNLDHPWATPSEQLQEQWRKRDELRALGWDGSQWNWDEDWDGQIIRNCYALERKGFIVTQFYRKRKIVFKLPPKVVMSRMELVQLVCEAIGSDWNGISFNRGIAVWWGPTVRGRW